MSGSTSVQARLPGMSLSEARNCVATQVSACPCVPCSWAAAKGSGMYQGSSP